jgi:hypothetical protein
MQIRTELPLLESLLLDWRDRMGADYPGYRHHVYRMLHFCFALRSCTAEEEEKLIIAGAFHDIGIWTHRTLDYLPPSVSVAHDWLERNQHHDWVEEISQMISEHHRLRSVTDSPYPLVELFRQGDLVDFSLGLVRCGLPMTLIRQVKAAFPNQGFHAGLGKKGLRWFLRHPLNPMPMMKWK